VAARIWRRALRKSCCLGQMQGLVTSGAGAAPGNGEQAEAQSTSGGPGWQLLGQADVRHPAGRVVSQGRKGQPGSVGGELSRMCIPVKSAGRSGRNRPPQRGGQGCGAGAGGAATIRLCGSVPVAAENVLGEAYITAAPASSQ